MKSYRIFFLLLFSTTQFTAVLTQVKNTSNETIPELRFKYGRSMEVPEFKAEENWIKEELWVETSFDSDKDGKLDRMHVWVTRPSQTNNKKLKLPVIYQTSPYYGLKITTLIRQSIKPLSKKQFWKVKHELGETVKTHRHPNLKARKKRPLMASVSDRSWVPRGFITVYSSSPGTGLSDGVATIGGENESLAPKAVIDWLCGRAKGYKTRNGNEEVEAYWCTGKVGMTGTSYDGTLCLAAATTGVEGLEAIVPVAPISSYYLYYRSNGLVRSPDGYLGEDMDVLYDFINTGDKSKRKNNNRMIRDSLLVPGEDRLTGDYNDFWDSRDYLKKIDKMHAALLMAHGFNDWNVMPIQSFRFFKAAEAKGLPVQLYYHEYGHGGDPPFNIMNKWFTRYLHGIENEVEKDAKIWIEREYEDYPKSYASFPDSNAADVVLYLKPLKNGKGDLLLSQPEEQQVTTIYDDYRIDYSELHKRENEPHRLLYVTPVLKKDLRLSGTPRVTIKLVSDKPAVNLSVYLIMLPWDEEKYLPTYHNVINRNWADPQNHASLRKGEPLKPGEFVEVSFDLMPDDQIIPSGKQIGLMIFSSDKNFTICPKPGTALIVDPNATTITIPVVGGEAAYQKAIKGK